MQLLAMCRPRPASFLFACIVVCIVVCIGFRPLSADELMRLEVSTTSARANDADTPVRYFHSSWDESRTSDMHMLFADWDGKDRWGDAYSVEDAVPLSDVMISGPSSMANRSFWNCLIDDQRNFYSAPSGVTLAAAFGLGAVLANTQADEQLQRHFQSSVRGATSDEWFEFLHANKELGNGMYVLPVLGAAWLAGEWVDGPPELERVGVWGERSVRGFAVGALPLIVTQRLTGASRPYETSETSEWQPFVDNNGVSGHAFVSSLPFITAAKMADRGWQRSLWYALSLVGPMSRVNDNAHYPSQIGLGWALAYVSATAVSQTEEEPEHWSVMAQAPSGEPGAAILYRW